MITAHGLTKRYGDRTAVQDLDFTVRPGTVTASPGPAPLALSLWAGTTLAAAALTLKRRDV
ncbi:hypothetical protein I6J40_16350 [Streptomyces californicus]|nr:hypothetical protein [Streptomyces californicus]QRV55607.1 hypothetical protein I6J40_16350 [Streptomyces californicus]